MCITCRSSNESGDANLGVDQVVSEYSSTVTEVLSGKDMPFQGIYNLHYLSNYLLDFAASFHLSLLEIYLVNFTFAGSENLTAVKSITKSIKILSPGNTYCSFSSNSLT